MDCIVKNEKKGRKKDKDGQNAYYNAFNHNYAYIYSEGELHKAKSEEAE